MDWVSGRALTQGPTSGPRENGPPAPKQQRTGNRGAAYGGGPSPVHVFAALCMLLQCTQRKYALLLASGSSSQAEGRRFETGLALHILIMPSATTAGGVFVGPVVRTGRGRIRPSGAAKVREREVSFLLRKHVGVLAKRQFGVAVPQLSGDPPPPPSLT